MDELHKNIAIGGYTPENVFNMDETGLFYCVLPARSYELEGGDSRQSGRGTKSMRAKDRVTLVLCLNATGSRKVDPLMIGTAASPHCFRDAPSPVPYTNQSNAWLDRRCYRYW